MRALDQVPSESTLRRRKCCRLLVLQLASNQSLTKGSQAKWFCAKKMSSNIQPCRGKKTHLLSRSTKSQTAWRVLPGQCGVVPIPGYPGSALGSSPTPSTIHRLLVGARRCIRDAAAIGLHPRGKKKEKKDGENAANALGELASLSRRPILTSRWLTGCECPHVPRALGRTCWIHDMGNCDPTDDHDR